MEFTKITSFVDLGATEAEKEKFIQQIRAVVDEIKKSGKIETNLAGASDMKTAARAMQELAQSQAKLTQEAKKTERALLDQAKASKLAAQADKEKAAAARQSAAATNEQARAELNQAKAVTETNKQKILQQKYEAAVTKEKERAEKAADRAAKLAAKEGDAYERLKKQYNETAANAKRLGIEKGLDNEETMQAIALAQTYYGQLIKVETAVGQSQRAVGQYTNATFALSQVLREAPSFINSVQTGFMALSNNLPILSDEFGKLSKATGSSMKALGIMFRSLFTFQTALVIGITLLTAYGKQIGNWISSLFAGSGALDKLRASQDALNHAFSDNSYAEAVKNLNELRINIDLAKKGFLDKDKVLKQYNESLGETIGEAKSLNEAEQLIVKNGPAYLKLTLLKAAANYALAEAAKLAVELAKQEADPNSRNLAVTLRRTEAEAKYGKAIRESAQYQKLLRAENNAFNKQLEERTPANIEAYDKLKGAAQAFYEEQLTLKAGGVKAQNQKTLQNIAEDFQRQAAELASKFNLDFFGGDFEDKDKEDKLSKTKVDFAKDLAKQQADQLKLSNEITRTRLEGEAAALLASAQKERKVLQERGESYESFNARQVAAFQDQVEAYQKYYDKVLELNRFNTKAQLAELDIRTAEEKRAIQEQLDDKTVQLTTEQRKELQDTLVAIDAKAAKEKELIVEQGNQQLLAFERQYESEVTAATKAGLDDRIKKRLEYLEKLRTLIEKERDLQNDVLATVIAEEQLELNKRLRNREITLKQYHDLRLKLAKKAASEELDNEIDYYERLLKATATTEEERRAIEAKLAELRLKKDQEITDKKIKNMEQLRDAATKIGNELLATFEAFVVGGYEREKNAVQDLIDKNEERRQRDLEIAQQTSTTAQEAADRTIAINARADAQKTALERKQRQIDQERARFERAMEISRIIGQTTALSGPPPAPPNPILAATIGATGALQLARVLATPIPKYAQGLDEAREDHLAIVGDGGRREVIHNPDGSNWLTPAIPTLAWIQKGASVSKSEEEARSVYGVLANGELGLMPADNGMAAFTATVKKEMKLTRQAIANKRENHFKINNGRISMSTKDGYNETEYLNQNLSF
jgi:hypothetical protein